MADRFLFEGSAERAEPAAAPETISVSELVAKLKACVEPPHAGVWVEGEIADFRGLAASGHAYFSLKDAVSAIRAKMWRSAVARLRTPIENGAAVLAHGAVEIYAPRGELSLVVDRVVPKGVGEAAAAFEQLRKKLLVEGLFAAERKRPLPMVPRAIGLVTSREGAAIRDFLRHLGERFPSRVVLAATAVQGAGAAVSIAAAIGALASSAAELELDAVAVIRGGGSIEDLAAFNAEIVARAIVACPVPVVTGVGHEIDTTIADLVADARAKTPTDAANVLVPDRAALAGDLEHLRERMGEAIDRLVADLEGETLRLRRSSALAGPGALLERFDLEVASLARLLESTFDGRLMTAESEIDRLRYRLAASSPRMRLAEQLRPFEQSGRALIAAASDQLARADGSLALLAARLEGVSPVAILARGYSITRRAGDARVITDATSLRAGDRIVTRLAHGEVESRVEEIRPETPS